MWSRSVRPKALASPASLKGVLSAPAAAAALAEGFLRADVDADACPIADGGEGTAEVLQARLGGEWRSVLVSDPLGRPVDARYLLLANGTAVVESAEAIGLARVVAGERDPLRASSRGLGELVQAALGERPRELIVCLGGSATVDGGAGMLEVLPSLSIETAVFCDVRNPLLGERGAARAFGPQKGASPKVVEELEARLADRADLAPYADLPGAGSAGGLGAALASLGARLVPGADRVLALIGFRERIRGAHLAVTGEGVVDRSTAEGKAPAVAAAVAREQGVRCAVFGGRVIEPLRDFEIYELSGNPSRARDDLVQLGERLGRTL
jgi:glycerate kinase